MPRQTFQRRLEPALTTLLEPGDRIVAGFDAQTGVSPSQRRLSGYVPLVSAVVYGLWQLTCPPPAPLTTRHAFSCSARLLAEVQAGGGLVWPGPAQPVRQDALALPRSAQH